MDTNIKNEFIIYNEFNDELIKNWKNLYDKGANYNLSYEWCSLWFKYFGKNKKLNIITLWENNELKLLAPFYSFRERLFLIGTKPDLYDEFNILHEDIKAFNKFHDYISANQLEISFNHINCESEIAKTLIKKISSISRKNLSSVTETKPVINNEFKPKRKLKDDIKRCQNNAKKYYEDEVIFEYSTERTPETIEEFIKLHTNRWNGGILVKKEGVSDFIREILKNKEISTLSRLYLKNSNKTVAYHLGYLDSNKVFWSSMPSYNIEYKPISPGKVLLFNLISECFEKNVIKFDFGRGSEPYKNWFANDENILFNIKTYNKRVNMVKIKTLIEKILNKIYG